MYDKIAGGTDCLNKPWVWDFFPEAVAQWCSVKKLLLEISENSQKNICAIIAFLTKLQAWNFIKKETLAWNFIKKETLAQVFSCEFCKISKNTFFYRTPPAAAFVPLTVDINSDRPSLESNLDRFGTLHFFESYLALRYLLLYYWKSKEKNTWRNPRLNWFLKAHRQISKKRCCEKYCSCDQACQVSALQGTPWRNYLENFLY